MAPVVTLLSVILNIEREGCVGMTTDSINGKWGEEQMFLILILDMGIIIN